MSDLGLVRVVGDDRGEPPGLGDQAGLRVDEVTAWARVPSAASESSTSSNARSRRQDRDHAGCGDASGA